MSSSPHADVGRSRFRSPRAWSLRTRLLASQIVLLALVCAAIGVGTEFALQRFLMNQLDDRLAETGRRSTGLFEFGPPPPQPGMGPMMPGYPDPPGYPRRVIIRDDYGPGPAFLNAPGQAARTVGAVISRHAGQRRCHHRRRHPFRNQFHCSTTTRSHPGGPQTRNG